MKITLLTFVLSSFIFFAQAKPQNLYEQLCEVNQEWYKNREIAEKLGFLAAPTINDEQDLLVFHIQALEQIFLARPTNNLTTEQQTQRQKQLKVLNEYWQRRDCPRNYYLPYRNPVFIDHEGRYCAVGYLMLKSGKQKFCEAVQKNSNFIYIRQIQSSEFDAWQSESGLSLDELAWIQPGYNPRVQLEQITSLGVARNPIILDSLQTLKIYNSNYDMKDMFGFQRMFWGFRLEGEKEIKKYKKYTAKTDWADFKENYGGISAMTVYLEELYVATDTTIFINDTTYQRQATLVKWNKQGKWEKILDLEDNATIYSFFTNEGKLYAGGGIERAYDETEDYRRHSYLLSFNGKSWKKINQEYGGIIFGLIYKNKKRYLGTVTNDMGLDERAPIPTLEGSAAGK